VKRLVAPILAGVMLGATYGCGLPDESSAVGSHCYLASADYLANGREWPDRGHVDLAFNSINTDERLDVYYTNKFNKEMVAQWLEEGYRVVIQYRVDEVNEHAIPIHNISECEGRHITLVFVSGYFNDNL